MSDFIQDPIESYKTAGFSYTIDLANWLQNNGSGNKNKPLVVLDVIAHELQVNGTMGPVPLPIKVNARGKLINSRITEKADSFCEYVSNNLIIYDNYRTLVDNYFASIHYLPYPRNPADAVIPTDPKSEYEYIDQLDIEEAFIPKMFSLATLYAMTDDQSADNQGLIAAQLQQYQMNVSQGG